MPNSPIYKSDMVTDDMYSLDAEFLHALIDSFAHESEEVMHTAMYLLLAAAAWDVTILDMTRSFLVSLVKGGHEGLASNIKATGVFIGAPVTD